ncbi:MAG TPA: PDGLE domain-containing protein [bacterium]|nr:PDGLE domain-containing protein [bacterium]
MHNRKLLMLLAVCLGIAGFLSLYASSFPDGLEYVAEEKGFLERATEPLLSIIPDYSFAGIANETLAASLAGVVGVGLAFGSMFLFGKILVNRSTPTE